MKVLALITYTDCENKYRSLQALGHEVLTEQYDDRPHERHGELVDLAKRVNPDFILYIGAPGEEHHHRPVPKADVLRAINKVAPMVHMCDDAADHPWWPLIQEYFDNDCFTVQVAIDGGGESPIARHPRGMCLLTPIDFRPFHPLPWEDRVAHRTAVLCGGFGHGERGHVMGQLMQRGVLEFHVGPSSHSYDEMAAVLCRHKIVFCHPMTGTGTRGHVKGRVIEAGFAGCVLLERAGSPTENWFIPGVHYLIYDNADTAEGIIRNASDGFLRQMGAYFHRAVIRDHHPAVFWKKVLDKMEKVRCMS